MLMTAKSFPSYLIQLQGRAHVQVGVALVAEQHLPGKGMVRRAAEVRAQGALQCSTHPSLLDSGNALLREGLLDLCAQSGDLSFP